MKIVITSATETEILLLKKAVGCHLHGVDPTIKVSFLETGVGILSTCFSLSKLIFEQKPDLIIQAGIAGSFSRELRLGEVVIVKEEILADIGVEENGVFKDIFDMSLVANNFFPFHNKKLRNPQIEKLNFLKLPLVTGITINEITTNLKRIEVYKTKYNAEIESMEGACLHYCCLQTFTSFIQIRSISNYVGERDKTRWQFMEACKSLADVVLLYLMQLNDGGEN